MGGTMRREMWGARKALVVAVMRCASMISAPRQSKAQSTIAAKKDGRAEIDAHAAEWLKESDVPSVAVAYIEDRTVAWTAVYGEQSPGVAATGKTLYNMASLTKPIAHTAVVLVAPDWICELEANDRRSAEDQMGAGNPNGIFGRGIQLRWQVCRKEAG